MVDKFRFVDDSGDYRGSFHDFWGDVYRELHSPAEVFTVGLRATRTNSPEPSSPS
jgi:hypothetical protein